MRWLLMQAVFAAFVSLFVAMPQAWSQVGEAKPQCNPVISCSNHAFYARPSADGKSCECKCRNGWSGKDCSVCPPGFTGADCDRCAPGGVLPSCRQCSVEADCSNHGIGVTSNRDGTVCQCTCRHQWSGAKCNVCPPQYAGADCDRCAPGLVNYPACTPPIATPPSPAQQRADCSAKCKAENCTSGTLAATGAGVACSCAGCTAATKKRTCGTSANGVKSACLYPTDKCLSINGSPKCLVQSADGMKSYQRCGEC